MRRGLVFALLAVLSSVAAGAVIPDRPHPGYSLIADKPYLTPDLDDEVFDAIWKVWPEEHRKKAEKSGPDERRRMAYSRYGLTPRPDAPDGGPLQYVVDDAGRWSMNCFTCHAGKVAGRVIPGLPNSHLSLQNFMAEVREAKRLLKKPRGNLDAVLPYLPLGSTRGSSNAVVFGAALMHSRDADLNFRPRFVRPRMVHHDMDAPPLWHYAKRKRLYIDGFAAKNHRALMQFIMIPANDAERLKSWEKDFRVIEEYLESMKAPDYPWPVDEMLASKGEAVFRRNCASCHGTYGTDGRYPNRVIPLEKIGTDPWRLRAITKSQREDFAESWLGEYGRLDHDTDPVGYVAPPLDGVWATAPYFHNGSVPTLWHVLHPDERPKVWKRTEDGYDRKRVGLEVTEYEARPETVRGNVREYVDTAIRGKSAAGHRFPERLTEAERRAVLEYLKTL